MRTTRSCWLIAVLGIAAIAFASSNAFAQGPAYQVADIAPNHPLEIWESDGSPTDFQPVAGGDVFLAPAGTGNSSIWRTDGTPEGTKPVVAGATLGPGGLIGSNGQRAFFIESYASGAVSVWATDGTPQGTVALKVGLGPPNDFGADTLVVAGRLFFHDCAPRPASACELWTSDGTAAGTQELVTLGRIAQSVCGSAGRFYFLAPGVEDDFQPWLWRTDGTAAGTIRLREFNEDGGAFECASVGGEALIAAEGKLWLTAGEAVELIATISDAYIEFGSPAIAGESLYFLSAPWNDGETLTVWRSDGTFGGTAPVLSTQVLYSPVMPLTWVQQLGTRIYYLVPSSGGRDPYSLWSSDTAGAGAQPVGCGGCASVPNPGWILAAGDQLFFPSTDGDVHSLWAIDANQNARLLRSYCTGYCPVRSAVAVGEGAMFALDQGGGELWATDGSALGTERIASFHSVNSLYRSASLGAALFSAALEFPLASNPWISRGTPESTSPLVPLPGEGSSPRELHRAGDRVAFLACREPQGVWGADADGAELAREGGVDCDSGTSFYPFVSAGSSAFFGSSQTEVWATDGTAATTRRVWDGTSASSSFVHDLFEWGPGLGFWAYTRSDPDRFVSFWQSDGTADGATRVFDLPLDVSVPYGSVVLGSEIYFRAQSPDLQIFRTDGTAVGTRRLTAAASGEFAYETEFTRLGASVYFTGRHGIWRTDGTTAGTTLAIPGPLDDDPFATNSLSWLHEVNGALVFQRTENGVSTLWRTLGTPDTTESIAELDPDEEWARSFATFAGSLYFAAKDRDHGVELWRTDGTAAGTELVRDLALGAVSGNPREFVAAGDRLLFVAEDAAHGAELWMSDGSTAGTRRVQDIAPQAGSSAPADLTLVGDLLYFSADDAATGRELWALPLEALPAPCAAGGPELCLDAGRFRIEVEWTDFAGHSGHGHASSLSGDTGYFWFFDPSIVELIVKVVDGRAFNGHFWVYYGALSNVEFTLTITDGETDQVWVHRNPSGAFASGGDILAFPDANLSAGVAASIPVEAATAALGRAITGSCVPDSSRLCLQGGRFALEVVWTDFAGGSGNGTAVQLTGDTGYFWFFSASNVEVVAKVVDGRPLNGNFWVYYGALSNVEYRLLVTDTVTGLQHEYRNLSGHFGSVGDIDPF